MSTERLSVRSPSKIAVAWRPGVGMTWGVLIVKVAFRIDPGGVLVQEESSTGIVVDDVPSVDAEDDEYELASDLVGPKPRVDVLVRGVAYATDASGRAPVTLVVGACKRSLVVWGPPATDAVPLSGRYVRDAVTHEATTTLPRTRMAPEGNVAPPEMQIDALREGAALRLDGLTPGGGPWRGSVPASQPWVLHEQHGRLELLPVLRLDTVAIDSEMGEIAFVYRGGVPPAPAPLLVVLGSSSTAPNPLAARAMEVVARAVRVVVGRPWSDPMSTIRELVGRERGRLDLETTEGCARAEALLHAFADQRAMVLSALRVDEATFEVHRSRHASDIERSLARGEKDLRRTYDTAYVEELELVRGAVTVEDVAVLLLGLERAAEDDAFASVKISRPASLRVQRRFTERMLASPELADELEERMTELRARS